MIKHLILHQWKESYRSPMFQRSLVINIVFGLFMLYMLASFAFLGFFIDKILYKAFPDQDPLLIFNGALIYYFFVELIMRLQLQELPVMTIQPYLHLPINRKKIIHYLLSKNLISFFNFFPLLVTVPFSVKVILPDYGVVGMLFWLLTTIFISISISYLCAYYKRYIIQKPLGILILFGSVLLIGVLDYYNLLELTQFSEWVFQWAIDGPFVMLAALLFALFLYYINYRFILSNTYMDEIVVSKKQKQTLTNITFLDQFGDIGQFILIELRLILRNKRSKSVVTVSSFFLFYGLIFYTQEIYMEGNYMLIFVGIFITGMFMLNYGQFIPSWEGGFFDGILTRNSDTYRYYLAKYYLLMPTCVIAFILSTPYVYFGSKVLLINFCMLFFNIGINSIVILFMSTYNDRRIDLSKKATLNWEGVGASQFIMLIPALVLPMLLFFPFDYFDIPNIGYAFIGVLGLVNFIFHKFWIKQIAKRFDKQKYKIAAGFRKE
ncbi:DUF5687 family protein [Chondrinema litorale]|uniref:DUF5687 family protein n=1 Tax=Chondrinema litorale TaxID=2994555 RepID=UPI0025433AC2|nr:DUF5687 family protein [Chondrinema litorale]UZR96055.1 DUF5687 family protein [Chondrinema litorale]